MQGRHRTTLFRCEGTGMTIHIDASINEENGDFIIEGQDFGPSVKEIFGDSDYEYWLTVPVASRRIC